MQDPILADRTVTLKLPQYDAMERPLQEKRERRDNWQLLLL